MKQIRNRQWFDLLTTIAEAKNVLSAKRLQDLSGYSLDTINHVLKGLEEEELVDGYAISPKGLEALEPYRAKRAVLLAAGFGERLVPISLNTPKPLVRVHGKRIIDGLIDACLSAGIEEIYIVRGYMAEQFDQLLYKYPMLRFLENPAYDEANNISSLMCARHLLANSYIFEADLLIHNPSIVTKYHYNSNFLGIPVEHSSDWCFSVRDGVIEEWKLGGTDCYQEVGISYWDEESGIRLEKHIELAYRMPGGKEKYWDQVPLLDFPEEYRIEVRECRGEDIVEIDTFSELKAIDEAYNS